LLTTRAALLLMLTEGPGFGRDLMRVLAERSRGMVDPRPGTVYPALASLVETGYVRRWDVVPGRTRGGRARTYYELTPRGMKAAAAQRQALAGLLLADERREPHEDVALMRERIRLGVELSEFGFELRQGILVSRGGG
jgi:DNA-binding PadR family transcriptional regulator